MQRRITKWLYNQRLINAQLTQSTNNPQLNKPIKKSVMTPNVKQTSPHLHSIA